MATQDPYRKLTSSELTKAYQRYARKYGYYVHTVRNGPSVLRYAAQKEYRFKLGLLFGMETAIPTL